MFLFKGIKELFSDCFVCKYRLISKNILTDTYAEYCIQAIEGRAVHSTVNRAEYSTHSRVIVCLSVKTTKW